MTCPICSTIGGSVNPTSRMGQVQSTVYPTYPTTEDLVVDQCQSTQPLRARLHPSLLRHRLLHVRQPQAARERRLTLRHQLQRHERQSRTLGQLSMHPHRSTILGNGSTTHCTKPIFLSPSDHVLNNRTGRAPPGAGGMVSIDYPVYSTQPSAHRSRVKPTLL